MLAKHWNNFVNEVFTKAKKAIISRKRTETYLHKNCKYDDDKNCCLKQVSVRHIFNFEHCNQTECHSSTKSTIRLKQSMNAMQ